MTTLLPKISWIDITQQEPQAEVLAIGYQEEMAIGYCYKADGMYKCELEGSVLTHVTHWMDLGELRVLRRLQDVK